MNCNGNRIIMGVAIGLSCLVVIFFALNKFMRNFNRSYDKLIKSHKLMYCYQTYNHISNDAIAVSYPRFIDSLKNYDSEMKRGKLITSFKYPAFFLPKGQKVYMLYYAGDSIIVKIAFYPVQDTAKAETAFVLASSLHRQ